MNRPYIIINCAMTADGKLALPSGNQFHISSKEDMKRVYELRNTCDAVLVGINTVLSDDPKLTVKSTYVHNPKQPLRIVLDSSLQTPTTALVVNTHASTLLCTIQTHPNTVYGPHVEILSCPKNKGGNIELSFVLEQLSKKGIQKLLVEGGGTVIWEFLKNKLVDDLFVYIGPYIVGGTQTPTMTEGAGIIKEEDVLKLQIVSTKKLGQGILIHYQMIS